jgi:excisionase family DNA binding protein
MSSPVAASPLATISSATAGDISKLAKTRAAPDWATWSDAGTKAMAVRRSSSKVLGSASTSNSIPVARLPLVISEGISDVATLVQRNLMLPLGKHWWAALGEFMEKLLLRPDEVASLLGVSRSKAYALIAAGAIPSVRLGGAVRVPADRLREWLSAVISGLEAPDVPVAASGTRGEK